jgi:mono/diheme cytochrome c family protein
MITPKILVAVLALTVSTSVLCAADAKENYEKNCAKCHGADGKGDTKMGKKLEIKDLTSATVQAAFTDEKAAKSIKEGIKDGDKTKMKAFDELSADEIKGLITYVRAFKK